MVKVGDKFESKITVGSSIKKGDIGIVEQIQLTGVVLALESGLRWSVAGRSLGEDWIPYVEEVEAPAESSPFVHLGQPNFTLTRVNIAAYAMQGMLAGRVASTCMRDGKGNESWTHNTEDYSHFALQYADALLEKAGVRA